MDRRHSWTLTGREESESSPQHAVRARTLNPLAAPLPQPEQPVVHQRGDLRNALPNATEISPSLVVESSEQNVMTTPPGDVDSGSPPPPRPPRPNDAAADDDHHESSTLTVSTRSTSTSGILDEEPEDAVPRQHTRNVLTDVPLQQELKTRKMSDVAAPLVTMGTLDMHWSSSGSIKGSTEAPTPTGGKSHKQPFTVSITGRTTQLSPTSPLSPRHRQQQQQQPNPNSPSHVGNQRSREPGQHQQHSPIKRAPTSPQRGGGQFHTVAGSGLPPLPPSVGGTSHSGTSTTTTTTTISSGGHRRRSSSNLSGSTPSDSLSRELSGSSLSGSGISAIPGQQSGHLQLVHPPPGSGSGTTPFSTVVPSTQSVCLSVAGGGGGSDTFIPVRSKRRLTSELDDSSSIPSAGAATNLLSVQQAALVKRSSLSSTSSSQRLSIGGGALLLDGASAHGGSSASLRSSALGDISDPSVDGRISQQQQQQQHQHAPGSSWFVLNPERRGSSLSTNTSPTSGQRAVAFFDTPDDANTPGAFRHHRVPSHSAAVTDATVAESICQRTSPSHRTAPMVGRGFTFQSTTTTTIPTPPAATSQMWTPHGGGDGEAPSVAAMSQRGYQNVTPSSVNNWDHAPAVGAIGRTGEGGGGGGGRGTESFSAMSAALNNRDESPSAPDMPLQLQLSHASLSSIASRGGAASSSLRHAHGLADSRRESNAESSGLCNPATHPNNDDVHTAQPHEIEPGLFQAHACFGPSSDSRVETTTGLARVHQADARPMNRWPVRYSIGVENASPTHTPGHRMSTRSQQSFVLEPTASSGGLYHSRGSIASEFNDSLATPSCLPAGHYEYTSSTSGGGGAPDAPPQQVRGNESSDAAVVVDSWSASRGGAAPTQQQLIRPAPPPHGITRRHRHNAGEQRQPVDDGSLVTIHNKMLVFGLPTTEAGSDADGAFDRSGSVEDDVVSFTSTTGVVQPPPPSSAAESETSGN